MQSLTTIATQAARRSSTKMSKRLMVGRDVLAIPESRKKEVGAGTFKLPKDQNVVDELTTTYSQAHRDARLGAKTFHNTWEVRVTTQENLEYERALEAWRVDSENNPHPGRSPKTSPDADGAKVLILKNIATKEEQVIDLTEDVRVSFDNSGSPLVETGRDILDANGALTTANSSDILIRVTGSDVNFADNSGTLMNFGSGGSVTAEKAGMKLIGSYESMNITAGEGTNVYSGVFTNCIINGGKNTSLYNGFFSATKVEGGEGSDHFSGLFLNNCELNGNGGDDSFHGTYYRATLNGGTGHNTFGDRLPGSEKESRTDLRFQFYHTTIDTGEGDSDISGVFSYSNIIHGSGENNLEGVFSNSRVETGEGESHIKAHYAHSSIFSGDGGNHTLSIRTAIANKVSLGNGNHSIAMGIRDLGEYARIAGGVFQLAQTDWGQDGSEIRDRDGTLENNVIDARNQTGTTQVQVNTGDERKVISVSTDENREEDASAGSASTGESLPDLEEYINKAVSDAGQAVRVLTGENTYEDFSQSAQRRKREKKYISTFSSRA